MDIVGTNTFKNFIESGYPFIESILSLLPICDSYFVNDGGSTDGTLEALQKLAENYPKIKLMQIPDLEKNVRWDSASEQYNKMIQASPPKCWVFLGNGDELIHEDDSQNFKEYVLDSEHRILRLNRREITYNWGALSGEVYHPARLARNVKGLYMDWNPYGGDEFLYDDGWHDPDRKLIAPFTLYHFWNMFPFNKMIKIKKDALYISPGDKMRVRHWEALKNVEISPSSTPKHIYPHLPALMKGLVGESRYYIRKELFDPRWVSELTGLKYN